MNKMLKSNHMKNCKARKNIVRTVFKTISVLALYCIAFLSIFLINCGLTPFENYEVHSCRVTIVNDITSFYTGDICTVGISVNQSTPVCIAISFSYKNELLLFPIDCFNVDGDKEWLWVIPDSLHDGKRGFRLHSEHCRIHAEMKSSGVHDTSAPFTISSLPHASSSHSIRIVQPNGGETFHSGDSITVRLHVDTTDYQIDAVVQLSIDGGMKWHILNDRKIPVDKIHFFSTVLIPDSLIVAEYDPESATIISRKRPVASSNCLLKVEDYDRHDYFDISDNVFTVLQ